MEVVPENFHGFCAAILKFLNFRTHFKLFFFTCLKLLMFSPVPVSLECGASSHSLAHVARTASELYQGFPGSSAVQKPPGNTGDVGLLPGSGRPPGEGNGNTLHYSCLRNPMDRETMAGRSPWGSQRELDMT